MDIEFPGFFTGWPADPLCRPSERRALHEEVARATRHRYPLGIALVRSGDLLPGECLHELQYWIKLLVRAGDRVCARESGDILVLLPGMPADRLTVRIRAVIAAANAASRISDLPALRWGVAAFPRDGASPETLLGVASAKAGRSRGCD